MNDDQILRKYLTRDGGTGTESKTDTDLEGAEDIGGAFGWLRSPRDRCTMIELRKKDGSIVAISYGWIERCEFDPSEGITLHAHGRKLHIKGRNLNAEARPPQMRLFEGICRNRVPWVAEADRPAQLKSGPSAIVIDQIEW
jgi:hypothetical protein